MASPRGCAAWSARSTPWRAWAATNSCWCLAPTAEKPDAVGVAQRVIEALKAPVRIAGVPLHISTSVGIAFYPGDATAPEKLIAHADAAMYCAKQRGRNNLQCFEPGMDTTTRDRVKLESDLHGALARQQFVLLYQPKVDTATDDFRSAEALIRWHHPERGVIMPEDFIPLAEDCGLISAIGEWVLREVMPAMQGVAARRTATACGLP